mmetsp:Transcript_9110/g.14012  ORF Transcript_9110/g.14012 Transcript_9110/m.14012 type:complete len:137 (+) Transcript_9110:51-461(+)
MFRVFPLAFLLLISYCLAGTLSSGEDVAKFVRSRIDANGVTVFSKSYCPYCKRTDKLLKDLLKKNANVMETVQLDQLPAEDGPLIQKQLLEKTGQRTVPNIFIGQKHIGGNSDLEELYHSGKLKGLLSKVASTSEL